jgi:hypothetical protein
VLTYIACLSFLFLGVFAKLRKLTISFVMSCLSVRPSAWKNSAATGRIFMKIYIWIFFQNLSRKFKFRYNLTRMANTLHEDICTFIIITFLILVRMWNFPWKMLQEKSKHVFCVQIFFPNIVPLWNKVEE